MALFKYFKLLLVEQMQNNHSSVFSKELLALLVYTMEAGENINQQ